jgi:hypothetical protein
MCLDASHFFNKSWLKSITDEVPPIQVPEHEYAFPLHLDLQSTRGLFEEFWATDDQFWQVQVPRQAEPMLSVAFAAPVPVQAPPPVPPEPEWSRARADVFVLTIETELYAVMYDKRKLIDQHALSQV